MSFDKKASDSVKGFAIILLCFHHMCFMDAFFKMYKMKSFLPQKNVVDLAVLARLCVPIFIFISAYGLTKLYNSFRDKGGTVGSFIISRLLILMSARWFVYPFQLLMAYLLRDKTPASVYKGSFRSAFFDFMGWGDFFGTPMIAGINWYMFLAQLIVILVPLFSEASKKFGLASLFYAYLAMFLLKGYMVSSSGGDYSSYLFVTVLGCYLAVHGQLNDIKEKNKYIKTLVYLALFVALMWFRHYSTKSAFDYKKLPLVGLAISVLLLCVVVTYFKDCIILKPFEILGKYSGNMYYLHIFIVRSDLLHKHIIMFLFC